MLNLTALDADVTAREAEMKDRADRAAANRAVRLAGVSGTTADGCPILDPSSLPRAMRACENPF